jgi:hypothetical protein
MLVWAFAARAGPIAGALVSVGVQVSLDLHGGLGVKQGVA